MSWEIPAAVFAMFPRKTSPRREKKSDSLEVGWKEVKELHYVVGKRL